MDQNYSAHIADLCGRIFRGDEFQWRLGIQSDEAEPFFAPRDHSGRLLEEKRQWLESGSDLYLATTPGSQRLIDEAWELALKWGHLEEPNSSKSLRDLSEAWEPDMLLIDGDQFSLAAGCVCFPSSWDLRTAIGKPAWEIHEVVPQLNSQLGSKIEILLRGIEAGKSYSRMNWGFTRTGELNYHPKLKRRRLDASVTIEDLFLRIEHQLFAPLTSGMIMGLRIECVPLKMLPISVQAWRTAARLIRTMPDDIAEYKSMATSRNAIADAMEQFALTMERHPSDGTTLD